MPSPDAGGALRYLLSGADVDILFTDIDLGEGMDGAQLAKLAREMRPALPIVYASGRRSLDQISSGSATRCSCPSPIRSNQVDADLAQLIGVGSAVAETLTHCHPAAREELLQPVDVIVAVDDVLRRAPARGTAAAWSRSRRPRIRRAQRRSRIRHSARVLPCTISLPTSES